ncbi:uncharacterized protein LOC129228705 [Uloborus diversus]|uniref:uncharacterized protein LOC129228705 n=1 Tax=Uloborus diversus TaxID=327109 RepID=UPI00240A295B|nr:uncharacterized protein LOC129228705 [Uloborus diversus]
MADTTDEWELSKENIQPLSKGRRHDVLKDALASQPDDLKVQQRQQFEKALRTYVGDDPLGIWYTYIKWVEQNFPKGGIEGQIELLIERCLTILKDEAKYRNDDRFIEIWLKFANDSNKPLEIFPLMQSNGIGCRSASFYIAWAWELEQVGNDKKANEILTLGLHNRAQPVSKMNSALLEFESRVAKRTKLGLELNDRVKDEHVRSAFSILKPQKKVLAPISRVGHSVVEPNRTNMTINRQQPMPKNSNTSKVPFKIYNAENVPVNTHVKSENPSTFVLHSENFKENEKKVCKWNKVKVKQQMPRVRLPSTNDTEFKVHCDEEQQIVAASKVIHKPSNVLSARKRNYDPPIALFEPPDPMKKPMYDKSKVYGGAEEFSFEEIRAAKWFAQKEKRDKELKLAEQERKIKQYEEKEHQMKKQIDYLTEKLKYLQSKFLNDPTNDFFKISMINLLQGKPSSSESYSEAADKIQELYNRTLNYCADETQRNLEELTENLKQIYSVCNTKNACHQSNDDAESISLLNNVPQINKPTTPYIFYHDPTVVLNQPNTNLQADVMPKSKENLSNKGQATVPQMNKPTTPYTFFHDPSEKLNQPNTNLQPDGLLKNKEKVDNKLMDQATVPQMNKPTTPYRFSHDPQEKSNQPIGNFQSDVQSKNMENLSNELVDKAIVPQINKTAIPYVFYHDPAENINQSNYNQQLNVRLKGKEKLNAKPMNINTTPHIVVYNDSQNVIDNAVPLQVTSDDKTVKTTEANVIEASCQELRDLNNDDLENIPPKGYIQHVENRELAGILEPSKNIMFIPLELQKMEEGSDTDDEIEQEAVKPHFPNEQTLVLPCNTQHFAASAFVFSTPCATAKRHPSMIYSKTENSMPETVNSDLQSHENLEKKEMESAVQSVPFKSEKKRVDKDRSTFPMLPNSHLSVIMENSRECYSKSSSSSSSSVNSTKSIKSDKYYSYQSMNQKHLSKLETLKEPDSTPLSLKCNFSDNKKDDSFLQRNELPPGLEYFETRELIDPFDEQLNNYFLKFIDIENECSNVFYCKQSVNSVKIGEIVRAGDEAYMVQNHICDGAYAKVYEVKSDIGSSNSRVAIKVCKNANDWELYICNKLCKRLKRRSSIDITNSVTQIISAVKYNDGIVLFQEYCPSGTLLDVVNKHQPEHFPERIAMYFTLELLHIVHEIHKCNIIHGDIKPDNILITNTAFSLEDVEHISNRTVSLRLADFGRGSDLNLFEKLFNQKICFNTKLASESFRCPEMRDGKPWVFQLDWHGVLCCVHVMLFSKYMDIKKNEAGRWTINRKLKRYWHLPLWEPLFDTLLNLPSSYVEPDIKPFTTLIMAKLQQNAYSFTCQLQKLTKATK